MELVGESLPSDSNSAEVLDSLPLRHVSFENCEETDLFLSSFLSRPDWMRLSEQKPRNKIGDAFAMGTGKFAWQLVCIACMPMSLRELVWHAACVYRILAGTQPVLACTWIGV